MEETLEKKEQEPIATIGYICTTPMVFERFVINMIQLVHYNMVHNLCVLYTRTTTGDQAVARNELSRVMRGDWLFMLDTDMQFDPNIFHQLLTTATENNLEILSGIYCKRATPYQPCSFVIREDKMYHADVYKAPEQLVRVDGVGAGCLLIKRNVFNRIREELKEEPFTVTYPYSEDLSFFLRVKKLNIPVYVAREVECGHLGLEEIRYKHFQEACKDEKYKPDFYNGPSP